MRLTHKETHYAIQKNGTLGILQQGTPWMAKWSHPQMKKHAEGGALKPQAVRLAAVASWRKLRRRGSERPGGSRRREGRPRASTR